MERISFPLQVKTSGDAGEITGYAAVFGNTDSDGEIIDRGAFSSWLKASNGIFPLLWANDRTRPVGWAKTAAEDTHGLKFTGKLMIDTEAGRTARAFIKGAADLGVSAGLSIGFTVPSGGDYYENGARHLRQIDLREVSVVTFPANDLAGVTDVKESLALAPAAVRQALEETCAHLAAARDMHRQAGERLQAAYDAFAPIPAYLRNDVNAPNPVGGGKAGNEALSLLRDANELLMEL